ncbi:MAG: (5-formylfuran-3-yl)methyl phosphate synthase [Planctomycetota bacterium]
MTLQPSDFMCGGDANRNVDRSIDDSSDTFDWLISVRNREEARIAASHGVDIIDLKEPLNGSLGSARPDVIRSILGDPLLRSLTLSVALGEGRDAIERASRLPAGFRFAKAGPAGMTSVAALREFWSELRQRIPDTTELVAVAYADFQQAQCPPPRQVVELAAELHFGRVLIDTNRKENGSSISLLGDSGIADVATRAARKSLWWSLAGSLALETISRCWDDWRSREIQPNCLAVRGDACAAGRTGSLCPERLRAWKAFRRLIRESTPPTTPSRAP